MAVRRPSWEAARRNSKGHRRLPHSHAVHTAEPPNVVPAREQGQGHECGNTQRYPCAALHCRAPVLARRGFFPRGSCPRAAEHGTPITSHVYFAGLGSPRAERRSSVGPVVRSALPAAGPAAWTSGGTGDRLPMSGRCWSSADSAASAPQAAGCASWALGKQLPSAGLAGTFVGCPTVRGWLILPERGHRYGRHVSVSTGAEVALSQGEERGHDGTYRAQ